MIFKTHIGEVNISHTNPLLNWYDRALHDLQTRMMKQAIEYERQLYSAQEGSTLDLIWKGQFA